MKRLMTFCLLVILSVLLASCIFDNFSSDQQLIDNYRRHRTDFNKLALMYRADQGLYRITRDYTDPEDAGSIGITKGRLRAYRRLFVRLGLRGGMSRYVTDKHVIFFKAELQSFFMAGSSKGYAYSDGPVYLPGRLVDNIDDNTSFEGNGVIFRRVEGKWYLFYDSHD